VRILTKLANRSGDDLAAPALAPIILAALRAMSRFVLWMGSGAAERTALYASQ
jgi:hypothetical protein